MSKLKKYSREEIEEMFKWVWNQEFYDSDTLGKSILDDTFERLDAESKEKWKPKHGEKCWFAYYESIKLEIFQEYSHFDNDCYKEGKVFPLNKPKKALKKMLELRKNRNEQNIIQ